ncbi:unnamed protein product [Polarella glacialis]|uniref:JmjC domain-containing protein n=1 Tax=Polarella glacialis TaxID=89957 RepID=A0A813KCZ6_POLGL|nr:unnamed protein product [Polarella glacialis]
MLRRKNDRHRQKTAADGVLLRTVESSVSWAARVIGGRLSVLACAASLVIYSLCLRGLPWPSDEHDVLTELVAHGRPAVLRAEQLPADGLLAWTPDFIRVTASVLRDVWAMSVATSDTAGEFGHSPTRFTYYATGKTLEPHLRTPWTPARYAKTNLSTDKFFGSCIPGSKERYFYSASAEGADGRIHGDTETMVASFNSAVKAASNVAPSQQRPPTVNVWLSCALTGVTTHYDMGHNLVFQTYGEKTFEVLPPKMLSRLAIPPAGHPYARQALEGSLEDQLVGEEDFLSFKLTKGDALYLPPLWAHRTTSGLGPSISVNVFLDSAAEEVAEQLVSLALPFEAHWRAQMMRGAIFLYLKSFLAAAGVRADAMRARWQRVELRGELLLLTKDQDDTAGLFACRWKSHDENENETDALQSHIQARAQAAAAVLFRLPQERLLW